MEPLRTVHNSKVLLYALTLNVHLLLYRLIDYSRQLQSARALAFRQWDMTLMQPVAGLSTTAQERRSVSIRKWGLVAPIERESCARHMKSIAATPNADGSTSVANHALGVPDRR